MATWDGELLELLLLSFGMLRIPRGMFENHRKVLRVKG
jgi:hypothetical protein